MIVLAPFDAERAAVEVYLRRPLGQTAPAGRDQGGAGAGATGLGNTGTPFPNPHAQITVAPDFGNFHIGPIGIQGMVLQFRANPLQVDSSSIFNKKDGMRI